jgi:hypothetical protein
MKKRVFIAGLMVLLSVALFSCGGGGGVGGGAEVFKTVTLTAESSISIFDSDVAKHTAIDTCLLPSDQYTDVITVAAADDVDVAFVSTINPGLPANITGSAVRLETVTVKYKPANSTSPALPDQKYALSAIVPANSSSLTVPIRIANQLMKGTPPLSNLIVIPANACTTNIFSYFVTLEFRGTEIDTSKTATFDTNLTINFSDFID